GSAEEDALQLAPRRIKHRKRSLWLVRRAAMGEAVKAEPGEVHLTSGVLPAPCGEVPDLASSANQPMEVAFDVSALEQRGPPQLLEQSFDVKIETSGTAGPAGQANPMGAHHTGSYGGLQAQLIPLKGSRRCPARPRLFNSTRKVAHSSEIGLQL